jgi:hypothetical protein
MTLFYNVQFGNLYNVVYGMNYPPSGGAPQFASDAVSGKATPANATEWTAFLASFGSALSAPQHLWLHQEASGNSLDTIGARPFTAASVVYQKPVTGWARLAMSGAASTTSSLTDSNAVSTNTTSFLWFSYVRTDPATTLRTLVNYGTTFVQVPDATHLRLRTGGNTATSTGAYNGSTVHPVLFAYNFTNSTLTMYTDLEKLTVTFLASTGHVNVLAPSTTADTAVSDFLYSASWDGVAGETTDAEAKKLITAFGYSPPWT